MADLNNEFETAAGTVTGADHYRYRQNRQDAWCVERTPHSIAAIVCDGCGDPGSPCSEVGASLGAQLLAQRLAELAEMDVSLDMALERARLDTLAQIGAISAALGDVECAVRRYFLFTVVGALITERESIFFSIGDGLIAVNDDLVKIGPYPDNAPPYMAYALLPNHTRTDARHFEVHLRVPTRNLDRFLLGTDGATPLLEQEGPGCWWADDIYFRNPAALSNRLRLLATDRQRIDWEAHRRHTERGLTHDDATLVLLRRSAAKEAAHDSPA